MYKNYKLSGKWVAISQNHPHSNQRNSNKNMQHKK